MSIVSPISHLLLVPLPAWGHTRPMCAFAARLVAENENIVVTILTIADYYEKSRFEIDRQLASPSSAQRVRLASITAVKTYGDFMAAGLAYAESYPAIYKALSGGQGISCSTTGASFEGISPPVAVILDHLAVQQVKATRALTGHHVPIICWITGLGSAFLRLWGPKSIGGVGDPSAMVQEAVQRTGRSALEIAEEFYRSTDGAVVRIPGVPAMYDYEFNPQKLPFDLPRYLIIGAGSESLKESDSLFIASCDAYEKDSLDALRIWQSDAGKHVHVVGPMLPFTGASLQSDSSNEKSDIAIFLDTSLNKYGQHSVVFISFGTMYWPTVPEHLDEVIDALIEKRFPFIFSHASEYAQVSVDLLEKIQTSGLGLSTAWAPQQFILNHPATGWFLSHGGHGSFTESLASGIPLICWSFDYDQPIGAAHIAENLKAAFELHEVKTNLQQKILHRTGKAVQGTREAVGDEIRRVLDACRGEEGTELRRNAEKLKEEFRGAWNEDGPSTAALKEFIHTYAHT